MSMTSFILQTASRNRKSNYFHFKGKNFFKVSSRLIFVFGRYQHLAENILLHVYWQLDVGSKLNNVSLLCLPMAVFTVEHLNDAQGYRLSL
jgi:hypothetical protein